MISSALTWTVHPARSRPALALLVLVFVVGLGVAAGWAAGARWLGLPFTVVLLGSVSGFFLPTTYQLDDESITVRHLGLKRSRPWSQVRRIDLGKTAALLSPFRKPRRLDRYRALLVRLDNSPPEARARLERLATEAGSE